MSGYNATTEVYYCKQNENPGPSHRIAPAPNITISPEIYYANDSVVGYTYNVTLNGYANALRKENDAGSVAYGADKTIQHMGDIREIFNVNGGNLYIKQNSSNIIVAKGCTVKNINFNPSENKWVNYSPFTIELEFNEIDFIGCSSNPTIACNSSFFNAESLSPKLIDINKYKIKNFSDKWSFTIDNQIYEHYDGILNNVFKVSYNLSATGKNYYVNNNLVPAWQQAKMFVQDRLFNQIKGLINGVLQIEDSNRDGCEANKTLAELYDVDFTTPRNSGLFDSADTLRDGNVVNYDIYNESINCSTSEADGSFSITYNAILKKSDPLNNPIENAALHTFTKNISTTNNPKNVTINVQGTVQGLVRGGFVYYNNDFNLPNNGLFISTIDSAETKYNNALNHYNTNIGDELDLLPAFKTKFNITKAELLTNTQCSEEEEEEPPKPSSFTLDHSYNNGTVGYTAVYDTKTSSTIDKGYSNVSIVRNDPVEIIQEFIIPGRISGPIIQRLGMKTSRTISINIDGVSSDNKECIPSFGSDCFSICDNLPKFNIKNFDKLLEENEGWVKTKEDYTSNKLDGSYSISLEYTCKG
jgi:hypothetical protein